MIAIPAFIRKDSSDLGIIKVVHAIAAIDASGDGRTYQPGFSVGKGIIIHEFCFTRRYALDEFAYHFDVVKALWKFITVDLTMKAVPAYPHKYIDIAFRAVSDYKVD